MVKIYEERMKSNFDGTIIDIETIGEFSGRFRDSRKYKQIIPVIFGFIDSDGLTIYYAENKDSLKELNEKIILKIDILKRPFYAFNCSFEMGVFSIV